MRIPDLHRLLPALVIGLIAIASPAVAQSNGGDEGDRPAQTDTRPQTQPSAERPSLRRRPAPAPAPPPPPPAPPQQPQPTPEADRESAFRAAELTVLALRV